MARSADTRTEMLSAAEKVVRKSGAAALTFEAVAKRLSVSKQAVIYWFPTKEDLVAAVAQPMREAEAEAGMAAIRGARDAAGAVKRFVKGLAAFHLDDLERFRLLHVAIQSPGRGSSELRVPENLAEEIEAATGAMVESLAEKIAASVAGARRPTAAQMGNARKAAVLAHASVLGLCLQASFADATGTAMDPPPADLANTLADMLAAKF